MAERFRPPPHAAPDTLVDKIIYAARLVVDFQFSTIHRHMRRFLPTLSGRVVDIGAGGSPFRHLLRADATEYVGLDIHDAERFGYANANILRFDGTHIPFATESVDHFVCTEVLEHVEDPVPLLREMHRILRSGGRGVITVPWSARYHYIPHDFHRFTPSRLTSMLSMFSAVSIEPRGTDLTTIVSKLVVAYARLLTPRRRAALLGTLAPAILLAPLLGLLIIWGHLSVLLKLGSTDDPLGYSMWVQKHE